MVRVLWRDAYFEFEGDGAAHPDYVVATLGHLITHGPVFMSVASERLPDGTFRAITHIPRELVLELTNLTELQPDRSP